jgi:hypothetical protein
MAAQDYVDAMRTRLAELDKQITGLTSERERLEQAIALVQDNPGANGAASRTGRRKGAGRPAGARTRRPRRAASRGRGSRTPGVSETIRSLISDNPGLTAAQVAERGKLKRASTATAISKMVRAGVAARDDKGGLTIPAAGVPAARQGKAAGSGAA